MRGDEIRVVDAFCQWLETEGWHVQREVDWVDVAAERHGQRLYAEVKGRTASPGLDVDTAYGQLLRRMKEDAEGAVFAMVVPQAAIPMPFVSRPRYEIALASKSSASMTRTVFGAIAEPSRMSGSAVLL
jgi:hypothetical protein